MQLTPSMMPLQELRAGEGYVCGRPLATVVFLTLRWAARYFWEGEAGVRQTEIAKALALALNRQN